MVRSHLLELVVLLVIAALAKAADVPHLRPCNFTGTASRDVVLQNGSTFTMTCISTEAGVEGATIRILRPGKRTVSEDELQRLNLSHVTWKKPNVQGEDSAIYLCAADSEQCTLSAFNATSLVVGYSPRDPVSHSCIGRNLEQFTCQWNMPNLKTLTHYRVSLRVGTTNLYSILPCNASEAWGATNVTCTLRTAGSAIYRIEEPTFQFTLTANNTFGNGSWEYDVGHYENVLLAAPSAVACNPAKTSAEIAWNDKLPAVSTFPEVSYQVRLVDPYSTQPHLVAQVLDSKQVLIRDLIPNTRYQASVRTKFVGARADLWSPYGQRVYCSTAKDRPTAAPTVAPNGFSAEDYAKSRDVRVYFRGIPRRLWNGDEMRYLLEWCSGDGRCGEEVAAASQAYLELRSLSHEQEYTILLYAQNEEGRSDSFARLVVPRTSELLPTATDPYVDESAPRYPKLFHGGTGEPRAGVTDTVFWRCRLDDDEETPEGIASGNEEVSWKVLTASDRSFPVPYDAGMCDYAVASSTESAISPMLWIECVVPTSREYRELVDGTDRIHTAEATESTIRLEFLTKCAGLVLGRNIAYYLGASEDTVNQTAGNRETVVTDMQKAITISGLSSGSNYVIDVASTLRDGRIVPHQRLTVKTRSRSPPAVTIGVGLGSALLVAVGYIIFHYCRRLVVNVVKYKATTVEVLVPADFSQDGLQRWDSVHSNLHDRCLLASDAQSKSQATLSQTRSVFTQPSDQASLRTSSLESILPSQPEPVEAADRHPVSNGYVKLLSNGQDSVRPRPTPSPYDRTSQVPSEQSSDPKQDHSNGYTKVSQLLLPLPERAELYPAAYADCVYFKTSTNISSHSPSDDWRAIISAFSRPTSSSPGSTGGPYCSDARGVTFFHHPTVRPSSVDLGIDLRTPVD